MKHTDNGNNHCIENGLIRRVLRPLLLMSFFVAVFFMAWGSNIVANAQSGDTACSRENLKGIVDKYFAALQAHDPSGLPLASNVKFTENGKELAVGEGFWKTAGKTLLRRDLIDTQKCGTHSNVVIEEKFDPATVGQPMMVCRGRSQSRCRKQGPPGRYCSASASRLKTKRFPKSKRSSPVKANLLLMWMGNWRQRTRIGKAFFRPKSGARAWQ